MVGLAYSFPYILAMSGDKISVYRYGRCILVVLVVHVVCCFLACLTRKGSKPFHFRLLENVRVD